MNHSRSIRRGFAAAFFLGCAAPGALMSGCGGSAVDNRANASGGSAGSAGAGCPLPATAALPPRCVECIRTTCPSTYADLCAANCGEAELGAPCLSAQREVGTCLGSNCHIECAMSHGSAVPGSTTSGATGPSNGGGSGAASPSGAGGSVSRAGDGGVLLGEGGAAGTGPVSAEAGAGGADDQCSAAIPLACGDRFDHGTLTQGRPNTWSAYSSTQRAESGRETLYAFSNPNECRVLVRLSNLHTDLDLLLAPRCDSISSSQASSTPLDLQTSETLSWISKEGAIWYVAVDGYAGAEGSYTLEVECACLEEQI